LKVFQSALENIKPIVEVKSRRVGGASYQVPVRSQARAQGFIGLEMADSIRQRRSGKSMQEKLASELMDAANRTGRGRKEERRHPSDGRGQ